MCSEYYVYGHRSGDLFVLKVMIYLLSLHEIMFYFIFVHNYILILDKAFNINHFVCLISYTFHCLLFLSPSLNSGGMRVKHDLIGCLYMFSVTWSIAIARLVFHRDVRCLLEVGISKVMFAQVGLLVHALSMLNFDGLYLNNLSIFLLINKYCTIR